MKKVSIYELKSLYRDDMKIYGWKFGYGEKSAVIAGGIRGNEIQQMFTCARLIKSLKEIEKEGKRIKGIATVVIDNSFAIHDIRIIEGDKGLFIAMPSRKTPVGEYKDIAHPINSEIRNKIQTMVLEKYEEALQEESEAPQEAAM